MSQRRDELLDIETEDERQARLQRLLEQVDAGTSPNSSSLPPRNPVSALLTSPSDNLFTDLSAPLDDNLLQRVRAFLPQIEASNAALAAADPREIDIEDVGSDEEQYIEMNLGLGVYEQRRDARRLSSSSSSSSSSSTSSSSSLASSSDSSSASTSSGPGDPIQAFLRASRPMRPLPQRAPSTVRVRSLSTDAENLTRASDMPK